MCVVVGEFHCRNVVSALMARYGHKVIHHASLHSVYGVLGLVCYLCVVCVEVFREFHRRLLDELHVTCSADDDAQRYRVVGLNILFVKLSGDLELSYATGEVGRSGRQRVYLQCDAWSDNLFLYFHVS